MDLSSHQQKGQTYHSIEIYRADFLYKPTIENKKGGREPELHKSPKNLKHHDLKAPQFNHDLFPIYPHPSHVCHASMSDTPLSLFNGYSGSLK